MIKYAEIGIKGKNRYVFEDALMKQIRFALAKPEGNFDVTKEAGKDLSNSRGSYDRDEVIEALKRVFGIAGICPVVIAEDDGFENLARNVVAYMKERHNEEGLSFKSLCTPGNEILSYQFYGMLPANWADGFWKKCRS